MVLRERELGEIFLMDGLDIDGNSVKTECKLVGVISKQEDSYIVSSEGLRIIMEGSNITYNK